MAEDGAVYFSAIAGMLLKQSGLGLSRLYMPAGSPGLVAEVNVRKDELLTVSVINAVGIVVRRLSAIGISPSSNIYISLSGLANGQYYLRVGTAEDGQVVRSFLKLQ